MVSFNSVPILKISSPTEMSLWRYLLYKDSFDTNISFKPSSYNFFAFKKLIFSPSLTTTFPFLASIISSEKFKELDGSSSSKGKTINFGGNKIYIDPRNEKLGAKIISQTKNTQHVIKKLNLNIDKNDNKNYAITEIYKVLRPGEPPTIEIATQIFNNLFFSSDRYDLSDVGRVKMNSRLNLNCSDKITILRNFTLYLFNRQNSSS